MWWYKTRVTRKGQVTVPVEIRRAMGLKEGDLVAFVQDGDVVRFTPWLSVAERTAGILKGEGPTLTAEEERAAFERAVAGQVAESLRD